MDHAPTGTIRARRRATRGVVRGFTLIELVVVVVILAVAAAMVVPRFSGTARQEADNAIERVEDLLRMFAFRESLGVQQVALWRDPVDGRIHLLTKDAPEPGSDEVPDWRPDRFASPVALPEGLELATLEVDDDSRDPGEWIIPSVPGGERPQIEVRLVGHGFDTTVTLPSGGTGVVRVDADKPAPVARFPVDLNRQGRGDEPW
jgi:prepilin-type N-terminal cleavage/methylation domain-containing protein